MCIVVDTCVWINFLRIGRMDLISGHPSSFISTDEVTAEIRNSEFLTSDQKNCYEAALSTNHIIETSVRGFIEEGMFFYLLTPLPQIRPFSEIGTAFQHTSAHTKDPLAPADRSVIAVAHNRNYRLATDDTEAIDYARAVSGNQLGILGTQEIMVELIQCGMLSVEEADRIRVDWGDNHRFKLKIGSFGELL